MPELTFVSSGIFASCVRMFILYHGKFTVFEGAYGAVALVKGGIKYAFA